MSLDSNSPEINPPKAPAVVKIHVSARHSLEPENDRRRWAVHIKQMVDDQSVRYENVEIEDPFTLRDYDDFERAQQARSGVPGLRRERSSISERAISFRSLSELREYRRTLREILRLDQIEHQPRFIKISISETLQPEALQPEALQPEGEEPQHQSSIHGLLWELLEHDPAVQVTRWITGIREPHNLPAGLYHAHEPIRLLLVIARSLQRSEDGTFRDTKNVVFDTLYAMARYLRRRGRHDRLAFDVVRPGTWEELGLHLERGTYDMVHLDVHGWVQTDGVPQLLFARPRAYLARRANQRLREDEELLFEYIDAERIARLLQDHHIKAVALSACLSSYNQRRPPSNMCRVFARFGVCAVTGMNFSVEQSTAEAYYAGFYAALVLSNRNFRSAAVHGRRRLQSRLQELHEDDERERERERLEVPRRQGRKRSTSASSVLSNVSNVVAVTEEDSREHDGWPMVTTYFTTDHLERTNSAKLGIDWYMSEPANTTSPELTPLKNILWTSPWLHTQLVPWIFAVLKTELPSFITLLISIILHAIFYKRLAPAYTTLTAADLEEICLTDFPAFREDLECAGFKHSTGLMALEARLKDLRQLHIQIYPPPATGEVDLEGLRDLWLTTGFADVVEIVPAWQFTHLRYLIFCFHLLRHILLRYIALLIRPFTRPHNPEANPPARTILIIHDFDVIFKKGPRHWFVLDRMTAYINAVEKRNRHGGVYLMILSSTEVDWLKYTWDPERHPWAKAESFFARPEFTTMNSR